MSVNSKMKAIADKIRAIRGTTGTMGLDAMETNLGTVQTNITSAFTSVGNKGGTVPTSKVSGNLASAIDSIELGVELNFEVVGGTTAPSNPKENTIWVNTSTTISSWVFSATQPTGATGKVWISTDAVSSVEFSALKENGIQVYPISAKQYVSGVWVDKTAKSYQNDKWVDWFTGMLFENGKDFEPISGGWYCNNDGTKLITTIPSGSGGGRYHIWTNKKGIDLSKYKTVYITVVGGHQDTTDMCIGIFTSAGNGSNIAPVVHITQDTIPNGTHALDVSGLSTGVYYIGFGINRWPQSNIGTPPSIEVSTVRMEMR